MASKKQSNNSVYKASGGFQNFVHSYGGKMWNDDDVQEAKAIGNAMKQYDAQQGSNSGGSAKSSSGGSAKSSSGGSAKSSSGSANSSGGTKSSSRK